MDNKFYVSLEAARLLKEKGYDRECMAYYQNDEFRPYSLTRSGLSIYNKNAAPHYMNQYSAPTKAEAIDWLESKGIYISIKVSLPAIERKKNMYSYDVLIKEGDGVRRPNVDVNWYSRHANRNECMQKAIEKALELL